MIELLMTLILHEMKNWDEVDINAYGRVRRMRTLELKYSIALTVKKGTE